MNDVSQFINRVIGMLAVIIVIMNVSRKWHGRYFVIMFAARLA